MEACAVPEVFDCQVSQRWATSLLSLHGQTYFHAWTDWDKQENQRENGKPAHVHYEAVPSGVRVYFSRRTGKPEGRRKPKSTNGLLPCEMSSGLDDHKNIQSLCSNNVFNVIGYVVWSKELVTLPINVVLYILNSS